MAVVERINDWSRSLGVRVVALLTVALLPVGLLAVIQTGEATRVAQQRGELTLLALTEQAAAPERELINRALGTAAAMAAATRPLADDVAICRRTFSSLVEDEDLPYIFAGYVRSDGLMECSSGDRIVDFSGTPAWDDYVANPRVTVIVNTRGAVSGESVIVVSHPLPKTTSGSFDGFVSISVPHQSLRFLSEDRPDIDLLTVNDEGVVLTGSMGIGEAAAFLPADLAAPWADAVGIHHGTDVAGRERVFAVVPLLEEKVFAIGTWPKNSAVISVLGSVFPAWFFPILMWAMSLAVAYFAVHRLVIRHIRTLMAKMRQFAGERRIATDVDDEPPAELAEIERAFGVMTGQILRDEAEAENRLQEQKILLQEVHHRVKNNLQLISSIINMQMRSVGGQEARFVLGRVRDRVLSLATIHRNLYESGEMSGIAADATIREIVDQLVIVGSLSETVEFDLDLDPIFLQPDQAVPLSLFVTEAATNALKHIGIPEGATGKPKVRISMKLSQDEEVTLTVENTTGHRINSAERNESSGGGLGKRLISAFTQQLEGHLATVDEDGIYRVILRFAQEGYGVNGPLSAARTA